MSLRAATYLPFTITCDLNGHHFVSERLRQAGLGLYQQDNAILRVADPVALQAAADAFGGHCHDSSPVGIPESAGRYGTGERRAQMHV